VISEVGGSRPGLPSFCFLRQKLYPTLSLPTQVFKMGIGDILLGVALRWTTISDNLNETPRPPLPPNQGLENGAFFPS